MNGGSRLKGFNDDTWINGIGNLYRKKGGSQWGINLSIFPRRENAKDATTLSNAPTLVRKRKINPTQDYYWNGTEKYFAISTTKDWQVDFIENCPALERKLPKEAKQYCFVFQLEDGTQIYLPQFELARTLFFHSAYLARSSVVHGVINNEFILEFDNARSKGLVNVLESFSGNWEMFNCAGYRRLLAWLLMDQEARQSYESIASYQLQYGYDAGQYRYWNFQFEPPPLSGAFMKVKGNFNKQNQAMFVYEIESIKNVPVRVPESVEFLSPRFYTQTSAQSRGSKDNTERPPRHNVDDSSEGGARKQACCIRKSYYRIQIQSCDRNVENLSEGKIDWPRS